YSHHPLRGGHDGAPPVRVSGNDDHGSAAPPPHTARHRINHGCGIHVFGDGYACQTYAEVIPDVRADVGPLYGPYRGDGRASGSAHGNEIVADVASLAANAARRSAAGQHDLFLFRVALSATRR